MSKTRDIIAKVVKVVAIAISLGFISLSGIEVISNYVGTDISFLGFNLTETQQQITSYVASGGFATIGLVGIGFNDYLNRKQREAMLLVNTTLEKFLTLQTNFDTLKNEIINIKKETTTFRNDMSNQLFALDNTLQEFNELVKVDLQAKLSNPLIDIKVQEMIKEALENGKEENK